MNNELNELIKSIVDNEFFQTVWFFGFLCGGLFVIVSSGFFALIESIQGYFKKKENVGEDDEEEI